MTKLNQTDWIKIFTNQLSDVQFDTYKDIKILTGYDSYGRPCLKIWKGRQSKPYINYYYNNENHLIERSLNEMKKADNREEYKANKRSFVPEFNVGDIYVASWGYEQTNVNAYQVIEKPSKHFAIVQEVNCELSHSEGYCSMSGRCTPIKNSFRSENQLRRKVGEYGISINDSIQASTK